MRNLQTGGEADWFAAYVLVMDNCGLREMKFRGDDYDSCRVCSCGVDSILEELE